MNDKNFCCRLCSKNDDILYDIFGDLNLKLNINDKIKSRLQIFISEEDFLSKKICLICLGRLEIFDKFVKDVHATQITFSKLHQQSLNSYSSELLMDKTVERDIVEVIEIADDGPSFAKIDFQTIDKTANDQSPCNAKKCQIINDITENECKVITNGSHCINEPETIKCVSKGKIASNEVSEQNEVVVEKKVSPKKTMAKSQKTPHETIPFSNEAIHEPKIKRRRKKDVTNGVPLITNNSNSYSVSDKDERTNQQTENNEHSKMNIKNSNIVMKKVDFVTQNGNTLFADLKALKRTLLLKRMPTEDANVFTVLKRNENVGHYKNTSADKGCQVDIVLYASSPGEKAIIFSKRSKIASKPKNTISIEPLKLDLNIKTSSL